GPPPCTAVAVLGVTVSQAYLSTSGGNNAGPSSSKKRGTQSTKYVVSGKVEGPTMDAPYGEAISNRSRASPRPTACDLDQNFTPFTNLQPPSHEI
ncbi:hypothetical protein THAOC_27761, partial [Thalassiosira oceanica]